MKILVTGDRDWSCRSTIRRALDIAVDLYGRDITVIEGAARGADSMAGEEARKLRLNVVEMPANWNAFGKAAGPIRNQQMLDEHPDIDMVFAFHESLAKSKGTRDMVVRALKKNLKVVRFPMLPLDVDF